MEMNTQRRSVGLKEKIPDIQKTLEMVKFLKIRRNKDDTEELLETNFELNDTLYARATVSKQDTEEVYLWLGANVMLAYPIDEAETMLTEKLRAAESSLSNCEEDLEFLREQITVFPSFTSIIFFWFKDETNEVDPRSCNGPGVQLGRGAEAQRQGRGKRR